MDTRHFWSSHDDTLPEMGAAQHIALSHDLYRGMPAWFNAYYAHFQQRAVKSLLRYCGPVNGMRVLDVGCGTGRWSELLAAMGARPIGVDIGLRALRLAATRPGVRHLATAGLASLGFADGVFDLALSVTVLQHIPRSQQRDAIAALARVLKPGGWLVACELVDRDDPATHIFANSRETWRTMFEAAGLRLVAYKPCEYLPYVKWFQCVRAWFGKHASGGSSLPGVSQVAITLQRYPVLAGLLQLVIAVSYPLEYLASWTMPQRLARLGGFLLVKG